MHYSDNNLLLFAKGCVNPRDEFNKRISKKTFSDEHTRLC
jgi:hypothetical protein